MIELCACGHANDHVGKPCKHPAGEGACSCPAGVRSDIALLRVTIDVANVLDQINTTMMRMLCVVEAATNLESRVVPAGQGQSRVDVRQRQSPLLVVPR